MEQITQKYTKYFYIVLLIEIIYQLIEAIVKTVKCEMTYLTIILLILSVVNIIIVGCSLKHNIKQEFTECKATTKIARITLALLVFAQMLLTNRPEINIVAFSNQILMIVIIEIWLTHRVKSIDYLENLANKISRNPRID